mmetsp:Transcript_39456/g.98796  ORF Transcript_39456/g.98796 Transcript_39456/m.98796 type:complete len:157 (+) Transcript_39456:195-665(+)
MLPFRSSLRHLRRLTAPVAASRESPCRQPFCSASSSDPPAATTADTDERVVLSTVLSVPGYEVVEALGVVEGNTVRTRDVARDFLAHLKSYIGGELAMYTQLQRESREEALDRLVAAARARGANGVIGLRYATGTVAPQTSEHLAYGTAVRLKRLP